MSEKRRIVVNTLANGVAQISGMLTALVFMKFLVNGFGAEHYGLYLLATSIAGYAGLLDLGVGASVTKMTAESHAQGDHERAGRVVSTAVAFYVVVGIVVAAIMVVLAMNTATAFKVTPDGARLLTNLLLAAAVWSLWAWPASTSVSVLAGHQRYTQTSAITLAQIAGNIVVTIAVLVAHEGPLLLMVGNYGVSFLASLAQVALAKRALGDVRLSPRLVDKATFRTVFSFAWAVFAIQICTVIVYQQTDRLVLGVFLGATAVALYEAAGKFQGLVSQLVTFSVSAVMPMASHLDAQGRQDTLRELFLRGTKYSLMLLNPVVIALIVIARPLLLVWLGPAFAAYAIAAQLLISHQVLTSGTAVGDSMILGLGQLKKRVPYAVAVAVLNLAISVTLVRTLGILGVVLGTLIPWLLDYPFHMRLILRTLDVPVGVWLRRTVLPTYPLLLLPALVAWALLNTALATSLLGIAAIGIVSVGAYWVAVYALGFDAGERAEVLNGVRAVWARATR